MHLYQVALFLFASVGWAAEDSATLSPIRVRDHEGLIKKYDTIKTEVISSETIEHKHAQTVAEAAANQVGVDAQNSCANCGSKRVTINGLRGEHTTVLIDGMPMHSAISSFYGLDAIPVVGIDSIEISRGAGASLVAPEAIGGVLNVITVRPKQSGFLFNGNLGNAGTQFASLLGAVVGSEGKNRFLAAGQFSHQGYWDVDGNRVAEAPEMGNRSFFVKASSEITESDTLEARYGYLTLGILGGTVDGTRPTTPITQVAEYTDFQDGNTQKLYTGTQDKVTDTVDLRRHELMGRWNHFFGKEVQLQVSSSIAQQTQNSLYMHGYDYSNKDVLWFNDARLIFPLGDHHFFTLGADLKNQDMNSQSAVLYGGGSPLTKDDFRYRSRSFYIQDAWLLTDNSELSMALRHDSMAVNWLAQTAKENEIDQGIWAPRVNLKVVHDPNFTSRLMYGRGYRPPLSFFESQHGLSEEGFEVQIQDIELSHGLGYSLNYSKPGLSITGSSHLTWIKNMAYADVSGTGAAILRNSSSEYRIWAADLVVSWDVMPQWNLQLAVEHTGMPDDYKPLLPAAAIENRVRLVSDYHFGDFEFVNTFTWIASRDLSKYGYDRHYLTVENTGLPEVIQPKNLYAPPYLTWDVSLGYKWKERYTFIASIQNVLDYTQAGYGDSPLNWSTHNPANKDHYHLDNNHTWGPLRGRVFSVGLKAEI
ncbi:TonB-dependent receptor [bacterium]|nr:TonB-dependent receptor [bacterium]